MPQNMLHTNPWVSGGTDWYQTATSTDTTAPYPTYRSMEEQASRFYVSWHSQGVADNSSWLTSEAAGSPNRNPRTLELDDIKPARLVAPSRVMRFPRVDSLKTIEEKIDEMIPVVEEVQVDEILASRKTERGYEFDLFQIPSLKDKSWLPVETQDFLDSKGFRKLPTGHFFFDPQVKRDFNMRKICEFRKAPALMFLKEMTSRSLLGKAENPQELKARELLRRHVGDKEFTRYLKFGYIVVNAHGYMWRIPGEKSEVKRVEQYQNNKLLNRYCVHFANPNIPSTDACTMRLTLVMAGVDVLSKHSNIYQHNAVLERVQKKIEGAVENTVVTLQQALEELKAKYGTNQLNLAMAI